MSNFVLVAETGSDIPPDLARQHEIYLVPMHVTLGERTLDDGTFPAEEICGYYQRTGTLPKTSGCAPEDFSKVFQQIHQTHPDKHILHLAYSAVTTVSYQSAKIAAEGVDYVTSIDTKHVSVGQAAIVIAMAKFLSQDPELSPEEVVIAAQDYCQRARMCFLPDDLEYLRAGGRVSNAVCLGGRLLHIRPRIELLDGHLVATKKYRGNMVKSASQLVREYTQANRLSTDHLWLLYSIGLPDEVRLAAEATAKDCGFASVSWLRTGCVITTHGGPGAFGLAGFTDT